VGAVYWVPSFPLRRNSLGMIAPSGESPGGRKRWHLPALGRAALGRRQRSLANRSKQLHRVFDRGLKCEFALRSENSGEAKSWCGSIHGVPGGAFALLELFFAAASARKRSSSPTVIFEDGLIVRSGPRVKNHRPKRDQKSSSVSSRESSRN
jgi:hypothetical protein